MNQGRGDDHETEPRTAALFAPRASNPAAPTGAAALTPPPAGPDGTPAEGAIDTGSPTAVAPPTLPPAGEATAIAGPPQPGQVLFNKYILVRKLGEGGMGTVWLVRHRTLGTELALKMLSSGIATSRHARERFLREARVMAAFSNHPHAVTVHDALVADEAAFIDMEYVRGRSIDKLLAPGAPMSLGWTARILAQLCDVLQEAHRLGIVHRDLSPSNLMLLDGRPEGREHLKVLDFGIAKILAPQDTAGPDAAALTEPGGFLGKAAYSSPEQINGLPIDGRSDLYSVGVMLYEFLTGYRPFRGSRAEIIYGHCRVPPPPFAEANPAARVPGEVERVVLRCLEKNPADRPQSAAELAEEFLLALTPTSSAALRQAKEAIHRTALDTGGPRSVVTDPISTAPMTGPTAPMSGPGATVSMATKPVPRAREHRPGLRRAWVALAVIALLAAVAVAVALAFRPPAAPTGPSSGEAAIAKQVEAWRMADYRPEYAGGSERGWPSALTRGADGARFVRSEDGFYLPAGYRPEGGPDPVDHWPRYLVRDDGVEFVRIAGDTFKMGNLDPEVAQPDDPSVPAHDVTLSGFYIQKLEVTNGEMEDYLREFDAGRHAPAWKARFDELRQPPGPGEAVARKHPAVGVPWLVARAFARRKNGRLPTEAQWEFAARSRGRRDRPCVWGEEVGPKLLRQQANIDTVGDLGSILTSVGGKYDNDRTEQGVMDLAGNVREWCRDIYHPYSVGPQPDPDYEPRTEGELGEAKLAVRGGSYKTDPDFMLTTARHVPIGYRETDEGTIGDVGFRLVIECPAAPAGVAK